MSPSEAVRPRRLPQTLALLAVVVVALLLAYRLRIIFIPLLIAFLLTYIWNPVVTYLERWMSRNLAIAVLYTVFFLLVLALGFFAIPALVHQGALFVEEGFIGESYTDNDKDDTKDPDEPFVDANANGRWDPPKFEGLVAWGERNFRDWIPDSGDGLLATLRRRAEGREDIMAAAGKIASAVFRGALSGIQGAIAVVSMLILVPVYMFFLLRNMNRWGTQFQGLIPAPYREKALLAMGRIHGANAAFFRGQILIALIEGTILFVGLTAMGVKLSFLFGAIYAVLAMIPFVGVAVTFAATILFVVAEAGFGPTLYATAGLFLGIQLLESLVLQPAILGKESGLHPMVIILSIFIFGELFGFFGLLLAVPLASATIILVEVYLLPILNGTAVLPPG